MWERFELLNTGRGVGMAGPERLRFTDIAAADRLLEWQLAPHEVEALLQLDLVWLFPDVGEVKTRDG